MNGTNCGDCLCEDYRVLSKNAYEKVKNDFDSEVFKQKFVENRLKLYNNIK